MTHRSQSEERAAPRYARTERCEQHPLTALEPACTERLVERDRDRCTRSVAGALEHQDELLHRHTEALRDRLQDADVRLMEDKRVDIRRTEPGRSEHLFGDVPKPANRGAEDVLTDHVH